MKIWPHGSNINFQVSAREMTFTDFERVMHPFLESESVIWGRMKPDKEEIWIYGPATNIEFNTVEHQLHTQIGEPLTLDLSELMISHEAIFDVIDDEKGKVTCSVLYLTIEENTEEAVYFFVDKNQVTHPLACVVEFWPHVEEIGREMDLSGCPSFLYKKGRS